jgi:hypothetical protein
MGLVDVKVVVVVVVVVRCGAVQHVATRFLHIGVRRADRMRT